MYTEAIWKEEWGLLFLHENIFILKLMVDIRKYFKNGYLRKVDKSNALVSYVYGIADTIANEVSTLKTPEADAFLNNLKLDSNENFLPDVIISGKKHTLLLNKHHKPARENKQTNKQDDVLRQEKGNFCKLKDRILTNIKENIKNQCGDNTYYYCWSVIDLGDKSSVKECINKLKDLLAIVCTEKVHVVKKHTSKKEDQVEPYLWNGYKVSFKFSFKFFRNIMSCDFC